MTNLTGAVAGRLDGQDVGRPRIAGMGLRLPIGDFSRMTHLSVKALRHYHDVGLLQPADVDRSSGYRMYEATQVPLAQVIRRFRDLGMPVEQVRSMLEAPDVETRNKVIVAHLEHMEDQIATGHTRDFSLVSYVLALAEGHTNDASLLCQGEKELRESVGRVIRRHPIIRQGDRHPLSQCFDYGRESPVNPGMVGLTHVCARAEMSAISLPKRGS